MSKEGFSSLLRDFKTREQTSVGFHYFLNENGWKGSLLEQCLGDDTQEMGS